MTKHKLSTQSQLNPGERKSFPISQTETETTSLPAPLESLTEESRSIDGQREDEEEQEEEPEGEGDFQSIPLCRWDWTIFFQASSNIQLSLKTGTLKKHNVCSSLSIGVETDFWQRTHNSIASRFPCKSQFWLSFKTGPFQGKCCNIGGGGCLCVI